MKPHAIACQSRQRGATLIVALVFLAILSLLGATVATNNTLQERMAGNTRNHDLAFQAAEHAIRIAQSDLVAVSNGKENIDGLITYVTTRVNSADAWRSSWPNGSQSASGVGGVCSAPAYVVESLPPDPSGNEYYRITARGVGGGSGTDLQDCIANGSAVVILQAMFRRGIS